MSDKPKKGQGGADDPHEKKQNKSPEGAPTKKFLPQYRKKGEYMAFTGQRLPKNLSTIPLLERASEQAPNKGKGKATAHPTAPEFSFPGKAKKKKKKKDDDNDDDNDDEEPERDFQMPPPLPPPPPHLADKQRKSKRPTGEYSTYPKKPPSGSFSEHSETSSGEVSIATTAGYTEPPLPYEVADRELRNQNDEIIMAIRGGRYWKSKLQINNKPQTGHQYSAFMLYPGQGGTFGYSNAFWNENGKKVHINGSYENAKNDTSKTKHLLWYGNGVDVQMIGTTGCISCLGVYFELRGNRVFCAHINALNHDGVKRKPRIQPKSAEYYQMKEMINRRFRAVSERDGWTKADYLSGTLTLVCPNDGLAAYAVAEAINEFLEANEPIEDSPGFIFTPGFSTGPNGPLGTILLESEREGDWKRYEAVPEEVKQIHEDGSHGRNVLQPWTYVTGNGPRNGWSWIGYSSRTWERGFANNRITRAAVPGFLSAK